MQIKYYQAFHYSKSHRTLYFMTKPHRRFYEFKLTVLDTVDCSDDDLLEEVANLMAQIFEAEEISIELIEASDYVSSEKEMAKA